MRINTFELFSSSILIHLVMPSSASQPEDVTGIANCFNQFYFSRENVKPDGSQPKNLKEFNEKLLDSPLKKDSKIKLDNSIIVNQEIMNYWNEFLNNRKKTVFFPEQGFLLPEIVFKLIIDTMFFSNTDNIASFTDKDKDEVATNLGFTENSEFKNIRDNVKTLMGYYRDCAICSGSEWYSAPGFENSKKKNERFLLILNLIANIDAGFKALYDDAKKASSSNIDQDFQESHERVRDHLKKVYLDFVDVSTPLLSAFKGFLMLRMSGTFPANADDQTIRNARSACDNDGIFKLGIESIGSVKDNSKFIRDYLENLNTKFTEINEFWNYQGSFLPQEYMGLDHNDLNGFKKLYSDAKKAQETKKTWKNLANKVKQDIDDFTKPLIENGTHGCPFFRKGAYVYLAELYLMAYEVPLTAKNEKLHKRLRATINLLTHILVMFGNTYDFAMGEECGIPILELFSTMNSVSNNNLLRSDLKSIIDRNQSNTLRKNVDGSESGTILKIFNEFLKNQAAIQEPTKNNTVFSSFLKLIMDGNQNKPPSNNVDVSERGKILSKLDDFRDPKKNSEKFLNPDFRESKKCNTFVLQLADLLMLSIPVCTPIHFKSAKDVLDKLDYFIKIIKSGINPPDFKFLKLVFQKNKVNEKDNGFSKLLEEIFASESSIIGKEKTISWVLVPFALVLSVSIVILILIYLTLKNRNKRKGAPSID
ncbi:hypothetical protein GINT2_001880 [Glugoides intestinalis]